MNASSSADKLRDLAVLVVDDHPVNREFLRAGLSGIVGSLDLVDSGEAAVERCRNRTYHVVLMDLHMPQMDGLATANRIRDLDTPSAHARMVVLTADARPEERTRMLDNGFDAYLSKPLSIMQLVFALRQLFDPALARQPSRNPVRRYSGSETLVDLERAMSATHGDAEVASRLGLMMIRELEEKLPLLDQFMINGRKNEAADLLHQWTGAGGFAGAVRFSRACTTLRRSLEDPAASSTGTAYTDLLRIAWATTAALAPEPDSHDSG